jgi:hypothetical protein
MTLAGSPSRPLSSSSQGAHQLCLSSNSPMTKRVSIPCWNATKGLGVVENLAVAGAH